MAQFRLLHIADLHFSHFGQSESKTEAVVQSFKKRVLGCRYQPFIARQMSDWIRNHVDHFDAVVITGDLADSGSRKNLNLVREFLLGSGDSKLQRPSIHSLNQPVIVGPGNHDRFDGFTRLPAGSAFDEFFRAFGTDEFRFLDEHRRVAEFELSRDNEQLVLLYADFCLRDDRDAEPQYHVDFSLGQGRIYEDTLAILKGRTSELIQEKRPFLWAIHFAPDPDTAAADSVDESLRLIESAELTNAARDLSVPAILCGHRHVFLNLLNEKSLPPIVRTGSACCVGSDNETGFQIVTVETGFPVSVSVQELRYGSDMQFPMLPKIS
jgi:3',5'-cyclic AMP phosphodiesterase CpdA